MYFSAFLHRDRLFEITNRWLVDALDRQDALTVTRIVNYDSYSAWETLSSFSYRLVKHLASETPFQKKMLFCKKDLKDFICNARYSKSRRVKGIIRGYLEMPEFFYVGCPLTAYLYHDPLGNVLAICRFKRVKRIAEKASRYAALYIFDDIRKTAVRMARHRDIKPLRPGHLPPAILAEAEKKVMLDIKRSGLHLPTAPMTIKDVLGIKVIDTGFGETRFEATLTGPCGARIVEKEIHHGKYNAIHYVVELAPDLDYIEKRFAAGSAPCYFVQRGLPAAGLWKDFAAFMSCGADRIQIDIILTSYGELIESEIGRSMHEARIFQQRKQQDLFGNIPTNIEFIIEYLFAVALSPVTQVDQLPIKIWGRYLPDTLSFCIRQLFQMPENTLIKTGPNEEDLIFFANAV